MTISEMIAVIVITILGSILIIQTMGHPAHFALEKEYQRQWCIEVNGTTEYLLPDKTRVDCLTPGHAIEFDFAYKWAESIGQALYYGIMTDRTPGVVLILEHKRDSLYILRLKTVAEKHGISVWFMKKEDLKWAR